MPSLVPGRFFTKNGTFKWRTRRRNEARNQPGRFDIINFYYYYDLFHDKLLYVFAYSAAACINRPVAHKA